MALLQQWSADSNMAVLPRFPRPACVPGSLLATPKPTKVAHLHLVGSDQVLEEAASTRVAALDAVHYWSLPLEIMMLKVLV